MVLDVKCPIQNIPRVPLLRAASIAEEFDGFVKWPTDIWDAPGRTVGGFVSSVQHRGDTNTIIVGLGLNVHQTVFPDTLSAVSLQQLYQQPIQRADVLMKVIKAMLSTSVHEKFDRWRERSFTLGKWVSVAGRKGLATGIREDGALMSWDISVTTGDVHLVENDDVTYDDVGNSNTVLGAMEDGVVRFRWHHNSSRTTDELGMLMLELFRVGHIPSNITGVCVYCRPIGVMPLLRHQNDI